jgi:peroxiredoxin Q/BCP
VFDKLTPIEDETMRKVVALGVLAGALAMGDAAPAAAQDPGANLLAVGEMAPDFELVGATRYGILDQPVRLSDYRGETVVLAFFFRVRTRG